jgi:hypothetical protein
MYAAGERDEHSFTELGDLSRKTNINVLTCIRDTRRQTARTFRFDAILILRALGRSALLPALEELTFSTYPLAGVLEALEARVAAGRGVPLPTRAVGMARARAMGSRA